MGVSPFEFDSLKHINRYGWFYKGSLKQNFTSSTTKLLIFFLRTKVNIDITDVNDNHPEFESPTVRISIPENAEIGVPLYAAHASDKDSGSNGVVRYKLVNTGLDLFKIDPKLGHLTLTRHLDYESVQRHTLMVTATDMGVPQLSSNLTILVEVQDMNDNPPVFEKSQYSLTVLESLPINTQVRRFILRFNII